MKNHWFLFLAGLLASCQGGSSAKLLDVDYGLDDNPVSQVRKPQPAKRCPLDTVTILANSRLDSLLIEASHEELQEYRRVRNIPAHVLGFLDCVAGGNFCITDPGMMWSASCVVDAGLPGRELTYLGVGKTIVIMTYRRDGVASINHVIITKSINSTVSDIWFGTLGFDSRAANKTAILDSLQQPRIPRQTGIVYLL